MSSHEEASEVKIETTPSATSAEAPPRYAAPSLATTTTSDAKDISPETLLIGLVIHHGFIIKQHPDNCASVGMNTLTAFRALKTPYELPLSTTWAELKAVVAERFAAHFRIDMSPYYGPAKTKVWYPSVTCNIDTHGFGVDYMKTIVRPMDETAWEAAKVLMPAAKGLVEIVVVVALKEGGFLGRLLAH